MAQYSIAECVTCVGGLNVNRMISVFEYKKQNHGIPVTISMLQND